VTGQLLYALIGYEATPTPLELFIYVAAILIIITVVAFGGHFRGERD
jgi:high-affinity Fe2+/Pb2+ permease